MWRARLLGPVRTAGQPAQVMVIFALASIPILAAVGLAIDGGNILAQRRLAQNGADAAALAGARDIARAQVATIDTDIVSYGKQNAGGSATVAYTLIDNSLNSVSVANATGVRTTVTKAFPTYFIQIVGFPTFTVSATAQARVQVLAGYNGAPFIVCAAGLKITAGNNVTLMDPSGVNGLINYATTPPSVNPAAIYNPVTDSPYFFIHGPQVGQNNGGCGWELSNNFKGNTPEDVFSGCSALPCWFPYWNGTTAGPTRVRVAGLPGCNAWDETELTTGCVGILPISAVKNSVGDTCSAMPGGQYMCVVAWGAFEISPNPGGPGCGVGSSNCHKGKLLGQVLMTEGAGIDWNPGWSGPLVVRLIQ